MPLINLDDEQLAVLRTALSQVDLPRPQEVERAIQTEPLDLDFTEIDVDLSFAGLDLFSFDYASRKKRRKDVPPKSTEATRSTPWIAAMLLVLTFSIIVCYEMSTPSKTAHNAITTHVAVKAHSVPVARGMSIVGGPSIRVAYIDQVLCAAQSPACGKGQALYNLGVHYGIDPAFALAFFLHESSFGTSGEATKTLSLGNLRCYVGATCVDQDRGGYASYPSWEAGFQAWYELIRTYYVAQRGLTTVDTIIPTYAPTADHNDEAAYIASVEASVATYRAQGGIA